MDSRKEKVTRGIHANQGIRVRYEKQLLALIDEMAASIEYWLPAQYKKTPPLLAQDASPSKDIQKKLTAIGRKWLKRFEEAAPRIAENYVRATFKATDSAMRMALKDSGFAVKFTLTPAMRDAFNATLEENIALIKSIPAQYLQQVQGSVMRGYTRGRDLESIVKDIRRQYPKASDRAVLIARDQSNKANAVVIQARQMELGITEAIWMHSHGGKTPRPSHVAANGKKYKVAEGCLIDGEYIFPGQKINCRCTNRSVLPGLTSAA